MQKANLLPKRLSPIRFCPAQTYTLPTDIPTPSDLGRQAGDSSP